MTRPISWALFATTGGLALLLPIVGVIAGVVFLAKARVGLALALFAIALLATPWGS